MEPAERCSACGGELKKRVTASGIEYECKSCHAYFFEPKKSKSTNSFIEYRSERRRIEAEIERAVDNTHVVKKCISCGSKKIKKVSSLTEGVSFNCEKCGHVHNDNAVQECLNELYELKKKYPDDSSKDPIYYFQFIRIFSFNFKVWDNEVEYFSKQLAKTRYDQEDKELYNSYIYLLNTLAKKKGKKIFYTDADYKKNEDKVKKDKKKRTNLILKIVIPIVVIVPLILSLLFLVSPKTIAYSVLTCVNNDGNAPTKEKVEYLRKFEVAIPHREGSLFKGYQDKYRNMIVDENGKSLKKCDWLPHEKKIVYAVWENSYFTITFDTDGGSEVSKIVEMYDSKITRPKDPVKTGYTFVGWEPELPERMPNHNLTVKAKWQVNQYTITFDTDGGTEVAPITQDYDSVIKKPSNPTKEGYAFTGWDQTIPTRMPAYDMDIKALWSINHCSIIFDTDGGTEIAPISQDYGTTIKKPNNPTKEGYTFIGWEPEIPSTMPDETMTIVAKWQINRHTITFDTDGGTEIDSITQDYGTAIKKPSNPTKTGYTFLGWSQEIPTTMPDEDLVIRAKWKINQYSISFDTRGGSSIPSIVQNYGTPITKPSDPTKTGYTFIGWNQEIPSIMPSYNLVIVAQWKVNQYTITFDTDGGTEIDPITQDYGTKIQAPSDPEKGNYYFAGWEPEIPSTMPAYNLTVKAKFETAKDYEVTPDLLFCASNDYDYTKTSSKADNAHYNYQEKFGNFVVKKAAIKNQSENSYLLNRYGTTSLVFKLHYDADNLPIQDNMVWRIIDDDSYKGALYNLPGGAITNTRVGTGLLVYNITYSDNNTTRQYVIHDFFKEKKKNEEITITGLLNRRCTIEISICFQLKMRAPGLLGIKDNYTVNYRINETFEFN